MSQCYYDDDDDEDSVDDGVISEPVEFWREK